MKSKKTIKNKTLKNKQKKHLKYRKTNYKKVRSISRKPCKKIHNLSKKLKQNKRKIMKGGAIPFSELNPSTIVDHLVHGVYGLFDGVFIDNAQIVPNNLPHSSSSNPSVLKQGHLDGNTYNPASVAGDSPESYFATP